MLIFQEENSTADLRVGQLTEEDAVICRSLADCGRIGGRNEEGIDSSSPILNSPPAPLYRT